MKILKAIFRYFFPDKRFYTLQTVCPNCYNYVFVKYTSGQKRTEAWRECPNCKVRGMMSA